MRDSIALPSLGTILFGAKLIWQFADSLYIKVMLGGVALRLRSGNEPNKPMRQTAKTLRYFLPFIRAGWASISFCKQ